MPVTTKAIKYSTKIISQQFVNFFSSDRAFIQSYSCIVVYCIQNYFRMFQNASDYDSIIFTKIRTLEVFKEFYQHLKHEEKEYILDVGSGSGNVTAEVLVPAIKHSNFRLVGIDVSKPMVDFATKYVNDPRLSFRVLDMTEKNEERLKSVFLKEELEPGFDKIFSFSVIMWTSDIDQCLRNMFILLRPGGQIFIWFVGYLVHSEIWQSVCSMEKWQTYLKNENYFKFPYHDSIDPKAEIVDVLKRIGFQDIICECDRREFYAGEENCKPRVDRRGMQIIDPYIRKLPEHLHSEYMDDVMEMVDLYETKPQGLTFDRIVVVATKPF